MAAPTIRLPYRGSHFNGGAAFDKIFYPPFTGVGPHLEQSHHFYFRVVRKT
jgi:hypothetical protein